MSGDDASPRVAAPGWPWVVTAAALVVAGSTGAWAAASALAQDRANSAEESFAQESAAVTSLLAEALEDHIDVAAGAAAWVDDHGTPTSSELDSWLRTARPAAAYPELLMVGVLPDRGEPVMASSETRRSGVTGSTSPAVRADACSAFAADVASSSLTSPVPVCMKRLVEAARTARDEGADVTIASGTPGAATLLTVSPVFAGSTTPGDVHARRLAYAGAVVVVGDGDQLLVRVTRAHSVAARLVVSSDPPTLISTGGSSFAQTQSTRVPGGMRIDVFDADEPSEIPDHADAMSLLLAGILISLLSASLVYALGTDRSRALRLVDVTTDRLRHQALHDSLTDLPNRALIHDRLSQLITRSRRFGTVPAVLYLDLDGFKNVNDSLGHDVGDELLSAIAARLTATLRNIDTIGRIGGDEFVVLVDGAACDTAPALVADRILEVMRQPFQLSTADHPLHVSFSIGVALGDHDSPNDFLRNADVAMYQAKGAGRNRCEIFRPEMQSSLRRRVELEFELRSALANGEFALVYQPIYNLDHLELLGAEALLRWRHPLLGEVQPEAFISILEATGQIVEVGRWVLAEACREVAGWHAAGHATGISINISGRQLDDETIIDDVTAALRSSGLPGSALTIEMTEGALMRNHASTAHRLHEIKKLGVKVAIDDFGTGYSSFSYLQQFPVDSLKIDRSFTNAITTSRETQALIRTLVQLGRDLGMRTVAEGVETVEEMDQLRREMVDEAQGYLLARPLDPEVFRDTVLTGDAQTRVTPALLSRSAHEP